MINNITGKENKTVKLVKSLKKKKFREENKKFIAEGIKITKEALGYAKDRLYCIIVSAEFNANNPAFTERADKICGNVYIVSDSVFAEISDTETPQGVMAVVEIPENQEDDIQNINSVVVLDCISEPGNMGTVIRTAEAMGFDKVYLMKGCTDIFSPKTVRSTMGSVFRMSFKTGCGIDDIAKLKEKGFSIISTTPAAKQKLEEFDTPDKYAVVIGNEAHGVSDEVLELSDYKLKITMGGMAESLNAAVAAGIAMHWLITSAKDKI